MNKNRKTKTTATTTTYLTLLLCCTCRHIAYVIVKPAVIFQRISIACYAQLCTIAIVILFVFLSDTRWYCAKVTPATIMRSYTRFQLVTISTTLDDLEQPIRTVLQKRCVFGASEINLNDYRPILLSKKMYLWIFDGFSRRSVVKPDWGS